MSGRNKRTKKGEKDKDRKSKKQQLKESASNSISNYVNDTSCLQNDIKEIGYPLMGWLDFVSLSDDNVLRILITGSSPNCNAQHIRNTCNYMYMRDVIRPIIKDKFPIITNVVSVYTFDSDFEEIVNYL